jgi:hypothetical protein
MQFGKKGDGGDEQSVVGQRGKKLRGHDGVKTLLHTFDSVSIITVQNGRAHAVKCGWQRPEGSWRSRR